MYFEVREITELKKKSSHTVYFSNAQIYRDHHNYSIDVIAVKIFSIENTVYLTNTTEICSIYEN